MPRTETWSVVDEIDRLCDDDAAVENSFFLEGQIDNDHRATVLRNVFLDSDERWRSAFFIMLILSGGIATLGLSQDSAATVIGSMIIAPLGAPMVGLGASLALAWPRQTLRMIAVVLLGAGVVVLSAFLMGQFLPNVTPTAQVLARTNPDLRDLGVAILAGAAGAYSQTRSSLSSSLVGVAIAVALVPPLAAAGLMLEEQRWTLAQGALTLFAANLVGITLAASVVLLLTGYVPLPRLRDNSFTVIGGLGLATLAVVVVSVPLTVAYSKAARTSRIQTAVYAQVAATTGESSNIDVNHITVNGDQVRVKLSDPTNAPAASSYEADLTDELGPNVSVVLE